MIKHLIDIFIIFVIFVLPLINFVLLTKVLKEREETKK